MDALSEEHLEFFERITLVASTGVEYTVSLTAEQADYYLRLAQLRASSPNEVMHEFAELIISKSKQDTQQNKAQYN